MACTVGMTGLWLLVVGVAGAGAGERQVSTQPVTTRPAASQPASRPAVGRDAADLETNLRRLRQADLAPLPDTSSGELQRMILELRSIRVSPRRRGKSPLAAVAVPESTSRPARTQPATRPVRTPRLLPKEIVQGLRDLPAGCVSRPAVVGDELYRGGYLQAACVLYERALKGKDEGDTKSWCLYQMGNCRRETDPAEAEKLYRRVTAEHGESLWAEAAAIEMKLLQWQRVNHPEDLLKSIESIQAQAGPATTRPAVTTRPASSQPAIAASRP